jgi:hypothetical protein
MMEQELLFDYAIQNTSGFTSQPENSLKEIEEDYLPQMVEEDSIYFEEQLENVVIDKTNVMQADKFMVA